MPSMTDGDVINNLVRLMMCVNPPLSSRTTFEEYQLRELKSVTVLRPDSG